MLSHSKNTWASSQWLERQIETTWKAASQDSNFFPTNSWPLLNIVNSHTNTHSYYKESHKHTHTQTTHTHSLTTNKHTNTLSHAHKIDIVQQEMDDLHIFNANFEASSFCLIGFLFPLTKLSFLSFQMCSSLLFGFWSFHWSVCWT